MANSLESNSGWVYRIFDRRAISIKAKNDEARKVAAVDLLSSLPLSIDVTQDVKVGKIEVGKTYYARINVYTSRDIQGVEPEFVDFFEVLDVDQTMEDFIKAYWAYPKLVKFELVETEPTDS